MVIPAHKRPCYLFNGHLETIWPSLFRKVVLPCYRRERINTQDDDFLDLDWLQSGCRRLAVISHGLEGDSRRHYVAGMAEEMSRKGWDVLAWNFRGCGGEINRQPKVTHNGATGDLHAVICHALERHKYNSVALVGFSMGGNISLVYLGRDYSIVPEQVSAAVCFSVPCDLAAASARLAETGNTIYMKRFLRLMGHKVKQQSIRYPELFPCEDYDKLKTFQDFDGRYTAPLHGFRDAQHYWEECSSLRYLQNVRCPTWIVNAANDPFLAPSCFPRHEAHGNDHINSIITGTGGHCGFASRGAGPSYWSELVASSLLSSF